ncbi:hypothetical protein PGIGA_G00236230 [Pangasianodon gigas]|uniref:Uncharacterized protein n=1 Tax=Pangasianodon gigas TaxID=30993 RepID=A0ACC5WM42_PANGG|nr:hypothetical protein [Pangasianodon gigas]
MMRRTVVIYNRFLKTKIRRTNPEAAAFRLPPIGAERLQERFTGHLVLRLETWIGTGILQDTTKKSRKREGFYFHADVRAPSSSTGEYML